MSGAAKAKRAASEAKVCFDKKTASAYSLASDGVTRYSESSDDEEQDDRHSGGKASQFNKMTLGEVFSMNHANLTDVVMTLMLERNMVFYTQRVFMSDDYFDTGKCSAGDDLELVALNMTMLPVVGYVEQAMIAGLQIIYHYAKNKRLNGNYSAVDASVSLHHNKQLGCTRFDVTYKLNGHTSKLAVAEEGGASYMSLYVED